MISIKTMVSSTPIVVRARANRCSPRIVKKTKKTENNVKYTDIKFKVKCTGSSTKNVIIKQYQKGAWVHCSCQHFRYYCEVALSMKGSSSILNSTGKLPRKTNPSLKPEVCKHIIACIQLM